MRDWLDNQYQNLFLYVPFLLAGGAALYFTSNHEPTPLLRATFMFICGGAVFIKRTPVLLRAIFLLAFGFCYADVFTNIIDTPRLNRNIHDVEITGVVKSIEYNDEKSRIMMAVNAADINAGNGVANIRVSIMDAVSLPAPGDTVRAKIGLFRPASAYAPETFDYARWAYFNKLTATGYADEILVITPANKSNIKSLRDAMHHRADSFLVDTLVLGYKGAIPKSDAQIWNATGIGHVWSISGFHMTLVGGWIFLIFYFLFRSVPYITRRIPAKFPAMCCAACGLMGYLFLSGTDVATIRAFLMTMLIFLAFIFGRSAISLRNVAIVFCVVFMMNPHYVMQAGFQLSFAAVFGMVWLYDVVRPKMPQNKLLKIIYACVLTSLVAMIFTAALVAMHFGAIPIYGLVGNLILLPVFSFVIMPLVFIGAIFGMSGPVALAHDIYDYLFGIAEHISNMPGAMINVPHVSNMAIMFLIMGLISLIFIKNIKIRVNYILFGVFSCIGTVIIYTTPRPIFYATYDNELVAFVRDDGKLEFNKSRASNHYFAFDTWKQINGEAQRTPNRRRKHDNGIYRYGNIVYVQKFVPLMKNIDLLCNDDNVKYIVSYYDIDSNMCAHKLLRGGFVIYPNGDVKYTVRNRRWN